LVEHIKVDYYGTLTPLKQLANISTPDARLIVIQPWDVSVLTEIEKAIQKSDIGIMPYNDGKIIRLPIPPLTHQRREELAKLVRKMAEEGRVSIRAIRRDANEHINKIEKEKLTSEDESRKLRNEVQKLTDKHIQSIDEILKSKEKELMQE
jgi:ribosome recycling factor